MFGKYVWIVFILLGAWQIIGSLLERANKKQQQQRLRELAAQRERHRGQAGHMAGGMEGGPAEPAQPARRPAQGAETLAARRRAQLEELRRRRAGRQPSVALPGTSAPRPAPTTSHPRAAPVSRPPPFQVTQATPRPQPVRRARPTMGRPAAAPPTPPVVPSEAQPVRQVSVARAPYASAPAPPRPTRAVSRMPTISADEPLSPRMLRRMVVLREILDPPVSLRDDK